MQKCDITYNNDFRRLYQATAVPAYKPNVVYEIDVQTITSFLDIQLNIVFICYGTDMGGNQGQSEQDDRKNNFKWNDLA
jgi:hypothetical protein